jgi:hypothetical protein
MLGMSGLGVGLYESKSRRLNHPGHHRAGSAPDDSPPAIAPSPVRPAELNQKPDAILRGPTTGEPTPPRALEGGESLQQ